MASEQPMLDGIDDAARTTNAGAGPDVQHDGSDDSGSAAEREQHAERITESLQSALDGTSDNAHQPGSHFTSNSTQSERSHSHPHPSQWQPEAHQQQPAQTSSHEHHDSSIDTNNTQTQTQPDTVDAPHTEGTEPTIKAEPPTIARDAIPAFIPVVAHKQEQATASTSDESSSILPSTEMPVNRGVKRPAPKSAPKKGLAKKGPPTKKQKLDSSTKVKAQSKVSKSLSVSATPLGSSPAPASARGDSPESDAEEEVEEDGSVGSDEEVFCLCKRPDRGTFMIACDGGCDDWFHGKCVGIKERDKGLIDRYICPLCTENGVGVTSWKRMCRREGCRLPARLAKKDSEPSKYCSDECGVLFFRSQLTRTRDATSSGKKSSRKHDQSSDADAGSRGGVITSNELKSLITAVSTFEEFKKLGDGVLSPPATPAPEQPKSEFDAAAYLDEAQQQRLEEIQTRKQELRVRHTLLRDQAKLISIVRQAGTRIAEQKGLKPKDVCGYDTLIHLDEDAFASWRESAEGQKVLKSGVIEAARDEDGDTEMQNDADHSATKSTSGPCLKKKCVKHHDWAKLALETNRSETAENSETMRSLEREENEIRERAGLKARQVQSGDLGGYAVRHDGANKVPVETLNGVTTPPTPDEKTVEMTGLLNGLTVDPVKEEPAVEAAAEMMEVEAA